VNYIQVFQGGSKPMSFTMQNVSAVPSEIAVDFQDWPDFALSLAATSGSTDRDRALTVVRGASKQTACGQGARYLLTIAPELQLELSLTCKPQTVGEVSFVLPASIQTGSGVWTQLGLTVGAQPPRVLASCIALKLAVSSSSIAYGVCIVRSKTDCLPVERTVTLSNMQDEPVKWELSKPSSPLPASCPDVFKVVPDAGELVGHGTTEIKVSAAKPFDSVSDSRCSERTCLHVRLLVPLRHVTPGAHATAALYSLTLGMHSMRTFHCHGGGLCFSVASVSRDCVMQVTFCPTAAMEYAATTELTAKLTSSDGPPVPILFIELCGTGRLPRLLLDRPVVTLPAVPLGFHSSGTFSLLNDGFARVEVAARVLCQTEGVQLAAEFPAGAVISEAQASVSVLVKCTAAVSVGFQAHVEIVADEGAHQSLCQYVHMTLSLVLDCSTNLQTVAAQRLDCLAQAVLMALQLFVGLLSTQSSLQPSDCILDRQIAV
jgi:hypothetical protein